MKIFHDNAKWGGKVNFVDKNNCLVGYDMHQDCCEQADYFFSEKINLTLEGIDIYSLTEQERTFNNSDIYNFDKLFVILKDSYPVLDEGGLVVFRLKAPQHPDIYLHIFNSHNGYYTHGFKCENFLNNFTGEL